MEISVLREISRVKDLRELVALYEQLSDTRTTMDAIHHMVYDAPECTLLVVREQNDSIIGTAMLVRYHSKSGPQGLVEDVVVSEKARGQGLGRQLMEALIQEAKAQQIWRLELTSNPSRGPANALYESLGFKARTTIVRQLVLSGSTA